MLAGDTRDTGDGGIGAKSRGASNILALGPTDDAAYFGSLLPATNDAVAVEYRRSVDRLVETWDRHAGALPTNCTVISVDDYTRSTAVDGGDGCTFGPATVEAIDDPADLMTLGPQIVDRLEEPGTVLTFNSLTDLLADVDLARAFRFLHVLTNHVSATGAVGYYRLDPESHDADTIAALSRLFDTTVRLEDGTWAID